MPGVGPLVHYNWRTSQTALHAQYVLTAYLTVFVVGVLLGMAFSPATLQERQWLAERSARLRAARELPPQARPSLVRQPHSVPVRACRLCGRAPRYDAWASCARLGNLDAPGHSI